MCFRVLELRLVKMRVLKWAFFIDTVPGYISAGEAQRLRSRDPAGRADSSDTASE